MQPEPAHVGNRELDLLQMLADQLGDHRAHFTEHFAAFLDEQFVWMINTALIGPVEEAEVVADVVGELGQQLGANDLELVLGHRILGTLDNHRRAGIAKDEMAVAVAEVHMPGADLRVDHEHGASLAGTDGIGRGLDAEGGGRTGHVHVEAEPLDTQGSLHLNGNRRVGTLQVGAGDNHAIDIGSGAPGTFQGLGGSLDRHLAENRPLVVAALGDIRNHAVDIENTALVDHVTALDTGRLLDELAAR